MRIIITILLLFCLNAEGQVIRANAYYRPFAPSLLLDIYPNAAAAYSLRKLRTAYTGAAIRVRKDTTGQPEQDISFDANGNLDTVALKSFINARSGFIVTWYDQSGNSRNLLESTQANQPRIASAGVIDRQNSKPHIRFDGSNDRLAIANNLALTNQTIFASIHLRQNYNAGSVAVTVWRSDTTVSGNASSDLMVLGSSTGSLSNERISWLASNITTGGVPFGVGQTTTDINLGSHLISSSFNFSTLAVNVNRNGSSLSLTNTSEGSFNSTNGFPRAWRRIGSASGGTSCLVGGFFEFVIYASDQSSNSTGIELNINSYYGIY